MALYQVPLDRGTLPSDAARLTQAVTRAAYARMALVPRVLEARSLDVVPGIVRKLRSAGDGDSAEVLELIEREEVAHVAAGSRWFRFACEREGRDPAATFRALIEQHMKGRIKGPFQYEARRAAGFDDDEITLLEELGG